MPTKIIFSKSFWAATAAGERVEIVEYTEYHEVVTGKRRRMVAGKRTWETVDGEHVRYVGLGEYEFVVWDGTGLKRLA